MEDKLGKSESKNLNKKSLSLTFYPYFLNNGHQWIEVNWKKNPKKKRSWINGKE